MIWSRLLGLKVNELIVQGQYWRLLTPMFLHGDILHLGFNMYALYIFGPSLERYFGHLRFITLFVLSGFAGNVLSFMFSAAPSLGSSTAIFGLLGAEGVFLYRNRQPIWRFGPPRLEQLDSHGNHKSCLWVQLTRHRQLGAPGRFDRWHLICLDRRPSPGG